MTGYSRTLDNAARAPLIENGQEVEGGLLVANQIFDINNTHINNFANKLSFRLNETVICTPLVQRANELQLEAVSDENRCVKYKYSSIYQVVYQYKHDEDRNRNANIIQPVNISNENDENDENIIRSDVSSFLVYPIGGPAEIQWKLYNK